MQQFFNTVGINTERSRHTAWALFNIGVGIAFVGAGYDVAAGVESWFERRGINFFGACVERIAYEDQFSLDIVSAYNADADCHERFSFVEKVMAGHWFS